MLKRRLGIELEKCLGASDWAGLLTDDQLVYARNDVAHLHKLREVLAHEIQMAGLSRIFELESALLPVITKMEIHGFTVATERMTAMCAQAEAQATKLEAELRSDFNAQELNPKSWQQLIECFQVDGIKITSTNEETLRNLKNPKADKVLKYRKATKLAGSITGLLEKVRNGRLHSTFNPLGAAHGRFSSKDPNLQNVPRGELRECFIPSRVENVLISADYSQIELRVAALIARDDTMIAALKAGEDLHAKIAAVNLHCTPEEVSKEQRITIGKASNFGFVYGQGAKGFQSYARTEWDAELTLEQATLYRNNYLDLYHGIKRWHNECWNKAKYSDLVEARTVWGRRLLPRKDTEWGRFNMFTEYVVSGSCADLIKLAMLKVDGVLPADVHLVATVHDELVYDAPADIAPQCRDIIQQAMAGAFVEMFGTTIPIGVEAKVCANWGEK